MSVKQRQMEIQLSSPSEVQNPKKIERNFHVLYKSLYNFRLIFESETENKQLCPKLLWFRNFLTEGT